MAAPVFSLHWAAFSALQVFASSATCVTFASAAPFPHLSGHSFWAYAPVAIMATAAVMMSFFMGGLS
jgi:hypothetical protein